MIDSHGRNLHKLRVQVLDACNLQCNYCMPEHPKFISKNELLTPKQLQHTCSQLSQLGIDEIRLTGGEPLLRPDLLSIIQLLSDLPLKKLGLTTNGTLLSPILPDIARTNLKYINISLDSLQPKNFFRITKKDQFRIVLDNILKSKTLGFNVKINVVVMKSLNDHEIYEFLEFSKTHKIQVRFLELMRVGISNDFFEKHFLSANQILDQIRLHDSFKPIQRPKDNTALEYQTADGAQFGIIASESKSFCQFCSRLRLTAKGDLRSCLFKDDGIPIHSLDLPSMKNALEQIANQKPYERIESVEQNMYAIGG